MTDLHGVFQPSAQTLEEIFSNSFYRIPEYQRPYSWGTEQIENLWDDLYDAFKEKEEVYFLGPMILIKDMDKYLEVVDGQQRLTTLTIFFCVIRDLFFPKDKTMVLFHSEWVS